MSWFPFSGTNPSDPTHYSAPVTSPICTGLPQQMCALQAANNGSGQPIITDALKNEMINSLENQVNGTNVKLKERI